MHLAGYMNISPSPIAVVKQALLAYVLYISVLAYLAYAYSFYCQQFSNSLHSGLSISWTFIAATQCDVCSFPLADVRKLTLLPNVTSKTTQSLPLIARQASINIT